MDNGTQEIQASIRARCAELESRKRDMEIALAMIGNEITSLRCAKLALDPEADTVENLVADTSVNMVEKVPLTGGGPGGFGSPGAEIKLGVPKPPAAKKRTPKRARG